ncbi:MAG TPA: hypothetical protein PKN62_02425 [bacterium]|nr:hypothetical protein [bacterium]
MRKLFLVSRYLVLGLFVTTLLTGCSVSVNSNSSKQVGSPDAGGVFRSINRGDSWSAASAIPTATGRASSIATLDSNNLMIDPSDHRALYFASVGSGLIYSYDGAQSWQIATSLGKINVSAVAVDYRDKCTIFAATANRLMRSTDCNRTWTQVYYDNDPKVAITSLLVDHHNANFLYLGTSRGDVLRSGDNGNSWQTVNRFDDPIRKIVMNPRDSRIMFAATQQKGLFRTIDGGATWENINKSLDEFKIGNQFSDLVISSEDQPVTYLATNYGLFRSVNSGDAWTQVSLLTPDDKTIINVLAINPKNSQEIYYATDTTFYRSVDGGVNWSTKKLPTSRAGWSIVVDPDQPEVIYLTAKKIKRKE